jgi:hypothetical protein
MNSVSMSPEEKLVQWCEQNGLSRHESVIAMAGVIGCILAQEAADGKLDLVDATSYVHTMIQKGITVASKDEPRLQN